MNGRAMSMKILMIGGTGNLSADCAALLHKRGHEVSVLSRSGKGVPAEYRTIVADYRDPLAMRAALQGESPEVVINFIGFEPKDVMADHALFLGRVRQYVFVSSATVYRKPPLSLPIREDAEKGNEWWEYAQKKLASEECLLEKWREDGFPVTIVRPSHTYSKLWIPNPVSSAGFSFASRLERGLPVMVPDDGENPWTLTAASDFAVGLCGLVGNDASFGEAFHITSDEVLSWNRIVAGIAAALGVENPEIVRVPADFICRHAPSLDGTLRGDKIYPAIFDNAKIRRFVPEFECVKPFKTGIQESVDWLRANPAQQNPNPQVDVICDSVVGAWRNREGA
jgi:nucleoside-diphosphate-sugar epimerase